MDDEAKSVLVEKQKNDSAPGPSSNSLISKPVKRKRGGKMEKDEKEYLDYLYAKGDSELLEMLDDEDDETPDVSTGSRKLSITRLPCTSHKVLKIFDISSLYANTKSSLGTPYCPEGH